MSFLTASLNDQMNAIDSAFRSNDLCAILRLMAANLTNTEAKMLEQARKYGVI